MTLRKKIANMFYGIGHAFESAKVSLSRGNPNTLNPTDASAELPSYTRNELVRKARYLEKNSGHIRGILRDLKVYGIGKGIYPNAKSDNHAWNKQAEDFFFKWSRHCDITSRFSWRECQSMILRSLIVDGEIFAIKTFDSFGVPKIQLIESHRLMSPSSCDSGRIVDGMEFDKFGRVKNYHFVVGDNSQTTKVPANAVLHIFDPEHVPQARACRRNLRRKNRLQQTQNFDNLLRSMDESKQKTLADAIAKIETLSAENTNLASDLEAAKARICELENELSAEKSAHNSANEKLSALEAKHRNIDKEVSARVAKVAAQSGVSPIVDVSNSESSESLEELAKRIDATHGIEKAKLIEENYDRIMSAMKGAC